MHVSKILGVVMYMLHYEAIFNCYLKFHIAKRDQVTVRCFICVFENSRKNKLVRNMIASHRNIHTIFFAAKVVSSFQ